MQGAGLGVGIMVSGRVYELEGREGRREGWAVRESWGLEDILQL